MAIYIEQTPSEVSNSFSLQRRAEISGVVLIGASISSNSTEQRTDRKISMKAGQKVVSITAADEKLFVDVQFSVVATSGGDPGSLVFSIDCTFHTTYTLELGYLPTEEEQKAFARGNAIFNIWPFFREFVQSTLLRLGVFGAPTLPFLRLMPTPQKVTKPSASPKETGLDKPRARNRRSPSKQ